jgi:diguanylate cyclase (GGDEF)-like protein/PAS domain S-box-containing protein
MRSIPDKATLSRLPIWAAAFIALICVGIFGLSSWRAWISRDSSLKTAETEMANLARSLTQHAEDTFELLDASIIGVATRLELEGIGPSAIMSLQKILETRQAGLKRIHGLFIYDENGICLATSGLEGPNISDREYFRHHMQSASRDAFIGNPIKRRPGGGWITTISRRFNHTDGTFGGLVLATVGSEYFSEFYQQFEIGHQGAITLLNNAGMILARSNDNETYAGRDLSNTPFFKNRETRPLNGVYYFKSPLDGVARLSFYKNSNRFPLIVLATRGQDEVLSLWRYNAITRMIFVTVLTMIIAAIGCVLVRQLVRGRRLMSALIAKEASFRLLAENSSDMVTRIGLDERLQYVSPSSARVVGRKAENLVGTPALAGIHFEDLPNVSEVVAALKRGDISETRIVYRSRHSDSKEVWIESALQVTKDLESGKIDGVVAISRDVTRQKNAEEKLNALVNLDGLTGLANRRCFDEELQEEWARAHREREPLSLLMIDVDNFKSFNDQYGHQAGDSCLQEIAQALSAKARRPADLAARYGGEEFVLLLPNTDTDGCKLVGDSIRQAILQLNKPHENNSPYKIVTVSLGGATSIVCAETIAESSSLVKESDSALYKAKASGRNCLMMADEKPAA